MFSPVIFTNYVFKSIYIFKNIDGQRGRWGGKNVQKTDKIYELGSILYARKGKAGHIIVDLLRL